MQTITLERGRTRVTIAPDAGGRVAQIAVRDRDGWLPLLYAPGDGADAGPLSWGSFVMAPWPNRIAGGVFLFEGAEYRMPAMHEGHALHGLGFDRAWSVDAHDASSAVLSLAFDERWPWPARAVQHLTLADDGLVQTVEVHSTAGRFPAGAGWHPWLRRDVRAATEPQVRVDADSRYEQGADRIPTGRIVPAGGDADLRSGPPAGDRRLDDCYRHPRGPLRLRWGTLELTMEQSPNVGHAVVYTPPQALCLEPQTCANDAFNLAARGVDGTGTAVVTPGAPLVASTHWRWREMTS